jgi:regulator of protease activity HflC (stomatin/prohibitin superfamily)
MADPRPTKLIVDCSTGERTVVELTDEEIAEREAMAAQAEADRLAQEQAEADRLAARASAEAKLAEIGLTADEIAAILS